ncbi:MAG: exodeoxyribonuclease VII large subunit [Elusimicrobia bacterium]|nr:exodeoxyribonuclease VII large subunit [Elusimicrobiota bacterium]
MSARAALSVTELSRRIHDTLEETFPEVWVEGELSDPRPYPSGHTYFKLKDAESQISAVIFRGDAAAIRFKLEHGLQVLARGRVTTYMKRGEYQFIVNAMEPKEVGALQLAFEQLKKKLQAEGLFDDTRKRAIPAYPASVGIVTSSAGAAVRDLLSVLTRRWPSLRIRFIPVPVQGDGAAARIAEAIEAFNEHCPDTEVLLVGRGGGSLEDLWAFNEEVLARAIAASNIPVVSCVGHETDFTIADFVADLRAPTPSAAAELVTPDRAALADTLGHLDERMGGVMWGALRSAKDALAGAARSPWLRDPRRIVTDRIQRVDELTMRLLSGAKVAAVAAARRLETLSPEAAMRRVIERAQQDLRRCLAQLDALSPLRVLERGYAIAFKEDGKAVLRSIISVKPGDALKVRLRDGILGVSVSDVSEVSANLTVKSESSNK